MNLVLIIKSVLVILCGFVLFFTDRSIRKHSSTPPITTLIAISGFVAAGYAGFDGLVIVAVLGSIINLIHWRVSKQSGSITE